MEIKTIGVLGAGQMGSGIAQIAASKGYKVILRDIKQEFCDGAISKMKAGLDKRVAQGKATQESVDATLANISTTENMADLKDCDMVIEAAVEILNVKQNIFKELGEICREDCIFCTNTSSMSISQIMSLTKNPERGAGMHFFFPVTAMKLVEVIRGAKTSDETVKAVYEVCGTARKN
jgi:3-hydroxybutyryl-CoA dehydrogenase